MTTGEIITAAMDRVQVMGGIEYLDCLRMVDTAHKWIAAKLRLPGLRTITPESFTWTTANGRAKDVSGTLTRWAERPYMIAEDSATGARWSQYPLWQVDRWADSGTPTHSGGRIYALAGNYLILVTAPSASMTVYVSHYQYPADLDSDADVPALPFSHHPILVTAAERDLWKIAFTLETNPTLKRGYADKVADAEAQFQKELRELTNDVMRNEGPSIDFVPPPIFAGAGDNVMRRRRHMRMR